MKDQKGFRNILVILIVLAVVGAGGYYLVSRNVNESNNQQSETNTQATVAAETADWKTYSSGRFKIKHKPGWEISEGVTGAVSFCPSSCRINFHDVIIKTSKINPRDYSDNPLFDAYRSYENFKVACQQGFGLEHFNPGNINDENKRCWLTLKNSAEVQEALQEVIESGAGMILKDYIRVYSDSGMTTITRDATSRISDKEFELMVATFKLIPQ